MGTKENQQDQCELIGLWDNFTLIQLKDYYQQNQTVYSLHSQYSHLNVSFKLQHKNLINITFYYHLFSHKFN